MGRRPGPLAAGHRAFGPALTDDRRLAANPRRSTTNCDGRPPSWQVSLPATSSPSARVHEAYPRLGGATPFATQSRLFRAAEAMRRILIDHGRKKRAGNRSGGRRLELSEANWVAVPEPNTLLGLDKALTQLVAKDPSSEDGDRLRLFAELSVEEAAGHGAYPGDGVPSLGVRPGRAPGGPVRRVIGRPSSRWRGRARRLTHGRAAPPLSVPEGRLFTTVASL